MAEGWAGMGVPRRATPSQAAERHERAAPIAFIPPPSPFIPVSLIPDEHSGPGIYAPAACAASRWISPGDPG